MNLHIKMDHSIDSMQLCISMNWDDLRFLLAVSRAGSLSGAARLLGINQSTVSRRVQGLEQSLKTALVERLPEGVVLTEAGLEIARLAEQTEAELQLTTGRVAGQGRSVSGPLTITCVDMMVDRFLAPHLAAFSRKHRGVDLSVVGSMGLVDVRRGQADVALRVTRRPDEGLMGRRLCDFGLAIYRARTGQPSGWVSWSDNRRIEACIPEDLRSLPDLHAADSFLTMNALVRAGMGMAVLPCYWADADDTLCRVLPDPVSFDDLGLWLLYHPDRRQLPRLRAFVDFIVERFLQHQHVFAGRSAREDRT